MNKEEIIKLLKIGENREIEFKESSPKLSKSLWETYSSFSNSNGGIIILGVEEIQNNNFEIKGVKNFKNVLKDFWNTINNKEKVNFNTLNDDDVKIEEIDGKTIIIISVPRAERKYRPIYINNNPITGTYKRLNDGDYRCHEYEIRAMITESAEKAKDSIILEEFDMKNINKETLKDYRIRFRLHKGDEYPWNKESDEEFLYLINAMDRESKNLTLAGLLMFGNVMT